MRNEVGGGATIEIPKKVHNCQTDKRTNPNSNSKPIDWQ
jgi:hypothetical protein